MARPYRRYTDQEMLEACRWWEERRRLGNYKSKAREMGMSPKAFTALVDRALKRHGRDPTGPSASLGALHP